MADLETTHDRTESRVWLWGAAPLDDPDQFAWGSTLDQLLSMMMLQTATWYFHNLKFDGETIILWLFEHGFEWIDGRSYEGKAGQMGTLINDKGEWFSMWFRTNTATVTLRDSYKIIPMRVEEMPEAFGLPERKGEIDHEKKRPLDYYPTLEEIEYVRRDVLIPLRALKLVQRYGLRRSTQASNALDDYKRRLGGEDKFRHWFPEMSLEEYDMMRYSYKGGWCYLNPSYAGKVLSDGIVLDKNSMYSYVMRSRKLPYGPPVHFDGKYHPDPFFPLWIGIVRFNFHIRPGRFPSIEIKTPGPWGINQYIGDDMGEDVCLCLTSVDWELIQEQYEVFNVQWFEGWKFRAQRGMFDAYVDTWYGAKAQADRQANGGLRQVAKAMQNSLYGKFGTCPYHHMLRPEDWGGSLVLRPGKEETGQQVYLPVASFITAYVRQEIIRAAQANAETFIYSDTDSLHLACQTPRGIKIDRYALDGWKVEAKWELAKYLKAKTYLYVQDGETHVRCAGLPYGARGDVTIDTFRLGARFKGKLRPVHMRGGMALVEGWFTILG